jgi:hypothetical protein
MSKDRIADPNELRVLANDIEGRCMGEITTTPLNEYERIIVKQNAQHRRTMLSVVLVLRACADRIEAAERPTVEDGLRRIAERHGIVYDPRMTFGEFALAIAVRQAPRDTQPAPESA